MTDETIFAEALEKPTPAERSAYLDAVCAGDPARRVRIDRLLAAHDQASGFLQQPAVAPPTPEQMQTRSHQTPADEVGDSQTHTHTEASADDEGDALAFLSPPGRPDSLGRIGHYEVLSVLGRGGFGIVFRAFDDVLQRVVAVKVLAPSMAATSPARKRFIREARTAAAIQHENVVRIIEVGEQPLPYLVMEFIPGETLQQRLDRTGPLELPEILRIGRQVAEALAAAHGTGLIHRDIKPSNILIDSGPQQATKITDFGLARAADDASLTRSGVVAGTPMYMAPEQAKGETLDHRADLFSLGSVLYVMCTGRAPFRASTTLAVLKRVAEDEPRPIREIIPEVPTWLCQIVETLHAKNPADRFQTAREVADVLADCEAQLKAQGGLRDYSRIPAAKPAKRRHRSPLALVLLLLLCVVGLGLVGVVALAVVFWFMMPVHDEIRQNPIPSVVGGEPVGPAPQVDGWVQLFNGKDLTGWKTHPKQPGDWKVEDGALVGRTGRAYLFTERGDYADFILRAECQISAGGEGGLFFRCEYAFNRSRWGGKWTEPQGYEMGIDQGNPAFPTGNLYGPDEKSPALIAVTGVRIAAEQWFPIEVEARGNRIIVHVGDRKLYEYTDPRRLYERGHIALEAGRASTTIRFRKIEIKEYQSAPTPHPAPPEVLKALRDAITAKERSRDIAKARFEAGAASRLDLVAAECELIEARVKLAETERDRQLVVKLLEELVAKRLDDRELTEVLIKAGRVRVDELNKADARLADAKARLAIARSELSPPVFPAFTDADVKRIAALPGEQQLKAVAEELKKRNPVFNGEFQGPLDEPKPRIDKTGVVTGLRFATDHVTDISPLRALRGLKALEMTSHEDGRLSDLSSLSGLPLTRLRVIGNPGIKDLSPLKGMSLTLLDIDRTSVTNIDVVKGMPLRKLSVCGTRVRDLTPLAEMSLDWLHIYDSEIRSLNGASLGSVKWLNCTLAQLPDEAELKKLGVEELWISSDNLDADAARLRTLGPRLKRINGKPADEELKKLKK